MAREVFQRARKPHEIAQRREAIIVVARQMLDEGRVQDLTLNQLAKRVGLAKSNVIRYFETREAILMHILQQDIDEWVNAQVERLRRMRLKTRRLERVVDILVSETVARPRLCQLGAVVASILERNVSAETAIAFKRANMEAVGRLVVEMSKAAPELTLEQYGELVKLQGVLVAGLWQHAHPTETMRKVLAAPGLAHTQIDFETSLRRGTALIAAGLVAGK